MNESYALGLALGLPLHEVEAIHYPTNRPRKECLRDVIIKFLHQALESRRNWSTITDALADPLVNHQALSESLKAAHFSDYIPTDDAISDPASTRVTHTGPVSPTDPATTHHTPTYPAPTHPAPTLSTPTHPAPTLPALAHPPSTLPALTYPSPTDPVPTDPAPADSSVTGTAGIP